MSQSLRTDVALARGFLNKLSMKADEDWLQGCVEFFRNERGPSNYTSNELNNMVRDQWMLCDLREMCPGSLPSKLAEQIKTTITGSYVLQMNYLINVAAPAYQQLQKSKKVDTTNIEVTANDNDTTKSGSTHRMLKLYLSDGVQDVTGIEYKPMRNLNSNLIPGVKILIKGPVQCRRGALLLEEKNVSVLGGEVDSLIGVNSFENILARTIGLTDNDGRITTPSALEFTREVIKPTLNVPSQNNRQTTADLPEFQDLKEADFVDDDDIDIDQIAALENQVLSNFDSHIDKRSPVNSYTNNNSARNISEKSFAKPSAMSNYEWLPPDSLEEPKEDVIKFEDTDMSCFLNEDFKTEPEVFDSRVGSSELSANTSSTVAGNFSRNSYMPANTSTHFNHIKSTSNDLKPFPNTSNQNKNNFAKPSFHFGENSRNANFLNYKSDENFSRNIYSTELPAQPPKKLKITKDDYVESKMIKPVDVHMGEFTENDFGDSLNEPVMQPFTKKSECQIDQIIIDDVDDNKSIVSLNQLCNMPEYRKKSRSFVVKSRIKTLRGKLKFVKDEFSLKCTLDDSTGLMDVDFSNKVLSDMIGYSPAEMIAIKRDMNMKPDVKEKVVKSLELTKEKLQSMFALMEITFTDNGPFVTNIQE